MTSQEDAAAAGPNAAKGPPGPLRCPGGEDQPPEAPDCAPPARPSEAPAREANGAVCHHVHMADADLSEGERTVLILNPHWKTVLWPFVLLVVVALAAAVLLIVIPHNRLQGPERIAVGAVALVIAVIWTGVPILRWKTTTNELTNRRFRLLYGFVSRTGR
jgi:uncharacterized membrane protein YqjE